MIIVKNKEQDNYILLYKVIILFGLFFFKLFQS